MTERILLPTDGDPGVEQAIVHAVDLAEIVGATLHAVYVVDETIYGAYSGDEFVQDHEGPQATLEAEGRAALEAIERQAGEAGVDIETDLRYGRPAEQIVAAADDHDVDSIILGSRTMPDAYRERVGSVADAVLRGTDRAVTVVRTPVEVD